MVWPAAAAVLLPARLRRRLDELRRSGRRLAGDGGERARPVNDRVRFGVEPTVEFVQLDPGSPLVRELGGNQEEAEGDAFSLACVVAEAEEDAERVVVEVKDRD